MDKFARGFLVVGGIFFGGAGLVGFSFVLSASNHAIPACGSGVLSGYDGGPIPGSVMIERARIMALNANGGIQTPATDYQATLLIQSAAGVSRVNIGLAVTNVGMSATKLSVFGNGAVNAAPGAALGASGAGAGGGNGGVATGLVINQVPSATQTYAPCGGTGGTATAPSLSTNGGAPIFKAAAYFPGQQSVGPFSAGVGSNGGVAMLQASSGGSASGFGMYEPTSLASALASGKSQSIQQLFASGGSPVMGGAKPGNQRLPYPDQAMQDWTIGGLDIPASTPNALDLADQTSSVTPGTSATTVDPSSGIDYLGQYASPDSGVAYLSQFATPGGAVGYLSTIAAPLAGQSPTSSSATGLYTPGSSGAADLNNSATSDDSSSSSSSSTGSSGSTGGAGGTSSAPGATGSSSGTGTRGH